MIATIGDMLLDWLIVTSILLLIANVSYEIRKSHKEKK